MVLVYVETTGGEIRKAGQEALTYGRKLADKAGMTCVALVVGKATDPAGAGRYGASRVLHAGDGALDAFESGLYASAIAAAARHTGARFVVMAHSANGKSLAGRVAVRLEAGCVSAVNDLPDLSGACTVRKGVYSGKAMAEVQVLTPVAVLTVAGNAIQPVVVGDKAPVEPFTPELPARKVRVKGVDKVEGLVPLPEAEIVVSAGRGMKGPENWGIVEELARELGATTACSRPVADSGWRPHHEHVGQTGIAIRPNLYIAIGISGAIQHLAGVNRSKVIVVINKDPEAPFFKAADYGVVGDLFEVVPRLTEAIRKSKGSH